MTTSPPVPWIADYAASTGFRYQPDADERWLRVWEPYTTLRTPIRYEHVLEATGDAGSITMARFVVTTEVATPSGRGEAEASAWIAIVQDPRISASAAATCDTSRVFGESLDLVTMPRRLTGDGAFDHVFASFAPSDQELARAITPGSRCAPIPPRSRGSFAQCSSSAKRRREPSYRTPYRTYARKARPPASPT